jgi:hypothetical protein
LEIFIYRRCLNALISGTRENGCYLFPHRPYFYFIIFFFCFVYYLNSTEMSGKVAPLTWEPGGEKERKSKRQLLFIRLYFAFLKNKRRLLVILRLFLLQQTVISLFFLSNKTFSEYLINIHGAERRGGTPFTGNLPRWFRHRTTGMRLLPSSIVSQSSTHSVQRLCHGPGNTWHILRHWPVARFYLADISAIKIPIGTLDIFLHCVSL